jgi:outer membrane biogenesis lipoprotein LolB
MMKQLLVIFWLTMVSGCALLPHSPSHVARPAQLETASFALNGRISINHHGERQSAGLHWVHRAPPTARTQPAGLVVEAPTPSDEILLLNPLGQTAARIYRDDKSATLDKMAGKCTIPIMQTPARTACPRAYNLFMKI